MDAHYQIPKELKIKQKTLEQSRPLWSTSLMEATNTQTGKNMNLNDHVTLVDRAFTYQIVAMEVCIADGTLCHILQRVNAKTGKLYTWNKTNTEYVFDLGRFA